MNPFTQKGVCLVPEVISKAHGRLIFPAGRSGALKNEPRLAVP